MNIGQRIREVREDLGMQAAVLARRVEVAPNTIYRIEAGDRTPSVALLEKIARELRTEPAELMREPVPLDEASETGPSGKSAARPSASASGHLTLPFEALQELEENQVTAIFYALEEGRITIELAPEAKVLQGFTSESSAREPRS
jgi:transcriptional regulator with XRE-family HTH domain